MPDSGHNFSDGGVLNPLREELYNEQMSSQGSTAGFITWTIQKGGRGGAGGGWKFMVIGPLCVRAPTFAGGYSLGF